MVQKHNALSMFHIQRGMESGWESEKKKGREGGRRDTGREGNEGRLGGKRVRGRRRMEKCAEVEREAKGRGRRLRGERRADREKSRKGEEGDRRGRRMS